MNPVLRLPQNTKGRDIVVADPHGQFKLLKQALSAIRFNKDTDRLVIAGDCVDKGENSLAAKDWLSQPYCVGAIGNHDAQFIFESQRDLFSGTLECLPVDPWFSSFSESEFDEFVRVLASNLYPAIEIETPKGLVGIVHAEVPEGLTWTEMVTRLNQQDHELLYDCMWSRELANKAIKGLAKKEQLPYFLKDIRHVFHGHTPSKKLNYYPYSLANRYYIDTGSYKALKPEKYPEAGITLFDVNFPKHPLYTTGKRELCYYADKESASEITL